MDTQYLDVLLPIQLSRMHNLIKERKVLLQPPVFQFTSINHSVLLTETANTFRDWNMEAKQCLQFYERATEIIKAFDQQWERATEELISLRKSSHHEKTAILQAMFATLQIEVSLHDERVARLEEFLHKSPYVHEKVQKEIDELDSIYEFYVKKLNERIAQAEDITDKGAFRSFVEKEIDLNLVWLDHVHNYMIPHFNIYLGEPLSKWGHGQHLPSEQNERGIIAGSKEETLMNLRKSMRATHHDICNTLQVKSGELVEVDQLKRKITELQNRAELLAQRGSSAVEAMQHKVVHLQQRLAELIELERVVASIDGHFDVDHTSDNYREERVIVFDHKLTAGGKATLMANLEKHWKEIIHHQTRMLKSLQIIQLEKRKTSIISIMSTPGFTTDTYIDEHGTFFVDEYGRKLYTVQGEDTPYQMDESGQLVLLKDDPHRQYYYDEIGRYYLESGTDRVYKKNSSSSEYMMCPNGELEKVREWRDGVEYSYDQLGRFRYYSDTGKKVYQESDTASEYVADEFGNLVREGRGNSPPDVAPCARSDEISAEAEWLRTTVGHTLARGLAQMMLMRPTDSVTYLTEWIFHDLRNVELQKKRQEERQQLQMKREEIALHLSQVMSCRCSLGSGEYSNVDENMMDYHPNSAVGNTIDGSVEDGLESLEK